MRILNEYDPHIIEEKGIYKIKSGKREDSYDSTSIEGMRFSPKHPFITTLEILEHIDENYDGKRFVNRCELPALARIIRKHVFEDDMHPWTARRYAFFLRKLTRYVGKVL